MKINTVVSTLMGVSVLLNAAIAIVGPFFPPEAEKKGVDMKTIGYIFSAYPSAFVIVSLVMPTILHFINQRVVFVLSAIIYAGSVAGFGSIVFMERNLMIYLGLAFRILQGSSNAALYTTTYSIFSTQYEGGDFMKVNSVFKGTIGGGLLLGLLIGTVLYIIGGYFLPFVVYSTLMLMSIPFVARIIPSKPIENEEEISKLQKSSDKDIEMGESNNSSGSEALSTSSEEDCEITIIKSNRINPFKLVWNLLCNKVILKCLVLSIVDMVLLNFAPAILSKRLSELNIDKKLYGLFFALPFTFPIVSAIIVVKVMQRVDSHVIFCIGKFLMGVAFLLIGPSYYWGFQENIWVMLSGISLLGFSASFSVIPLMPIIMTEIKARFSKNTQNYINTASSLYNSAFGLGSIIGPMLGAHLSSHFGFRICTDILSHFSMSLLLILLAMNYSSRLFGYFGSLFTRKPNEVQEKLSETIMMNEKQPKPSGVTA